MVNSFLSFIFVISVIVFIHEMGHYLAARLCGVMIEEFSIGFGPTIISYKDSSKTKWKISLIPLGGYVKMFGDQGLASESTIAGLSHLSKEAKQKTFTFQSPLRRCFIAIAGPLANYVLSLAIFASIYSSYGKVLVPNIVSSVEENSPAFYAGIKSGDAINSINGNKTDSFEEIYSYVSLYPKRRLKIEIVRYGNIIPIELISGQREIRDSNNHVVATVGVLGIKSYDPTLVKLSIFDSVLKSIKDIILISRMTFTAMTQMFLGERSLDEIRGTITMVDQSGSSLDDGILSFVTYIGMISINIGFVNLLPIPILDGGHVVLCLYEMVARKRPGKTAQAILNVIGLVFIIFMFVISTSNDIKALLSR